MDEKGKKELSREQMKEMFQESLIYMRKKDNEKAAKIWKELEKHGHNKARYNLAIYFFNRSDLKMSEEENDENAARLFRKLIHRKNKKAPFMAEAHYYMGWLYEEGRGVDPSVDKAAENYLDAAEMGYERAIWALLDLNEQECISDMECIERMQPFIEEELRRRKAEEEQRKEEERQRKEEEKQRRKEEEKQRKEEEKQRRKKEVEECKKEAEQGVARAQYKLAGMYEKGYGGIRKSDVIAAKWYREVAEQNYLDAQTKLKEIYKRNQSNSEPEVLFCNGKEMSNTKLDIGRHIYHIYHDFYESLYLGSDLCELTDIDFKGGHTPEYDTLLKQQYYLLRYEYGHIYMYKCMFLHMLERLSGKTPELKGAACLQKKQIKVTSIGCGNFTDYWGLMEAIFETRPQWAKYEVDYIGIDLNKWPYRNVDLAKKNGSVLEFSEDAVDFISEKDLWTASDAFVFPFSMSELGEDRLRIIAENIAQRSRNNVVCILMAYSQYDGKGNYDMAYADMIGKKMEESGWTQEDQIFQSEDKPSKRIKYFKGEFDSVPRCILYDYKTSIIDNLCELYKSCENYGYGKCSKPDGDVTVEQCQEVLNMKPMFLTGSIRYQLRFFYK